MHLGKHKCDGALVCSTHRTTIRYSVRYFRNRFDGLNLGSQRVLCVGSADAGARGPVSHLNLLAERTETYLRPCPSGSWAWIRSIISLPERCRQRQPPSGPIRGGPRCPGKLSLHSSRQTHRGLALTAVRLGVCGGDLRYAARLLFLSLSVVVARGLLCPNVGTVN